MRCVMGVLILLAAASPAGSGSSPGPHEVLWSVVGTGGGGPVEAGSYAVWGTVGQPANATETARGGTFAVTAGFWAAFEPAPLFADGFESGTTDAWSGQAGRR